MSDRDLEFESPEVSKAKGRPALRRWIPLALAGVCIMSVGVALVRPSPAKPVAQDVADGPALLSGFILRSSVSGVIKSIGPAVGDMAIEGEELIFLEDGAEFAALQTAQKELQKAMESAEKMNVAVMLPPSDIGGTFVRVQTPASRPGSFAPLRPDGPLKQLPPAEGASEDTVSPQPEDSAPASSGAAQRWRDQKSGLEAKIQRLTLEIEDAKLAQQEADRAEAAAQGIANQAKQDAERLRILLQQGAVAANKVSEAENVAIQAQNNVEIVRRKYESSRSAIPSKEAELSSAQKELSSMGSAPTEDPVAKRSERRSVEVRLPAPQTGSKLVFRKAAPKPIPARVDLDVGTVAAVQQKIIDLRKKVDQAEARVLARRIKAPRGMRLVQIHVKPGEVVKPGSVIATFEAVPQLDLPEMSPGPWWRFQIVDEFSGSLVPGTFVVQEQVESPIPTSAP